MNLDAFYLGRLPKPEVQAKVIRRSITAAADYIRSLAHAIRGQINSGPDGITRTLRSTNQFQADPVVFVGIDIAKKRWNIMELVDHDIDFAVVEQITESRASGGQQRSQTCSLHRRDDLKLPIPQIVK